MTVTRLVGEEVKACVQYGVKQTNGNKTHENRFHLQKRNFDPTKHTHYTVATLINTLECTCTL